MTEAPPLGAGAEARVQRSARGGALTGTWIDRLAVALVVLSLFFDRLDRTAYLTGRSAIPDLSFDLAVALLGARYLYELARGHVRLARIGAREYVLIGFVLLLALLSVAAIALLPTWMVSVKQVAKTGAHVVFLIGAMLLIGRALSHSLLELALKLYFGLVSAAAALAIVQAVDVNALNGALTRHLDLIVRAYPNGYKAPVSIFPEPAHLGYFALSGIVVGVLCSEIIGRRLAIIGCLVCGAALLLALSVGPILVAAALLAVLLVARRRSLRFPKRAWAAVAVVVVLLVGVVVVTPAGPAISARVSRMVHGQDGSSQYRSAVIHASIHLWKLAPATGVGLGNTRHYLPTITHDRFAQGSSFNNADAYVSLLGEAGPLGTAGFLLLIGTLLWPPRRPQDPLSLAIQLGVLVVVLSLVVDGAFPPSPIFWFWGGLRLADARFRADTDSFGETMRRAGRSLALAGKPRLAHALLLVVGLLAVVGISYAVSAELTSTKSEHQLVARGTMPATDRTSRR